MSSYRPAAARWGAVLAVVHRRATPAPQRAPL